MRVPGVYFEFDSDELNPASAPWIKAAALKRELVGHYGVADLRLDTRGFGAFRPLESNASVEGRARNRRVELVRPCERRTP